MNKNEKITFHKHLAQLFEEYENRMIDSQQLEIIQSGFVFSNLDYNADVIVMGMNPSLRTNYISEDGYSYNYNTLSEDMYFKKLHAIVEPLLPYRISYTDLFYQKHSEQLQLKYFLKDETGRAFLKDQLALTLKQIARAKPRIILLFNKQGGDFLREPWIPIKLTTPKDCDILDLKKATLYNTSGNQICQFFIYFSTYLGYRTSQAAMEKVHLDVPKISRYLGNHDKN